MSEYTCRHNRNKRHRKTKVPVIHMFYAIKTNEAMNILKIVLLIFYLFINTLIYSQVNPNYHQVEGYYRSNGTYVKPHYKTNPNSTNIDNYTTKPNINPHTGKKGYIEPDNKYNYYQQTSPYNNSTTTNYNLNSTASFYTNYGQAGELKIWIDGKYKGKLNSYFSNGTPECGQSGTLSISLTSGKHKYRAEDNAGFYWEGYFNSTANSCYKLKLSSSAEKRYSLGVKSAKKNYKTSFLNYLVPYTISAFDPYYGAVTTLTISFFPPKFNKIGDKNYDKGYRRSARKKKILVTLISFGAGVLTHELIM